VRIQSFVQRAFHRKSTLLKVLRPVGVYKANRVATGSARTSMSAENLQTFLQSNSKFPRVAEIAGTLVVNDTDRLITLIDAETQQRRRWLLANQSEVDKFSALTFSSRESFHSGLLATASSITTFRREAPGWDHGSGEGPRIVYI
jgi:hypothetical protein